MQALHFGLTVAYIRALNSKLEKRGGKKTQKALEAKEKSNSRPVLDHDYTCRSRVIPKTKSSKRTYSRKIAYDNSVGQLAF